MEAAESWERYPHNCSNQTVCWANDSSTTPPAAPLQ